MNPMASYADDNIPLSRHSILTNQRLSWITIQKALVLVLVICAIGLPRGLGQGSYVTIDENLWLYRSANFFQALSNSDFANTFQKGHPGVTVTWIGTMSFLISYPAYVKQDPGQLSKSQIFLHYVEDAHREPLQLLQTSRKLAVLVNILVLILAYLSAIPLVGFYPASLGFLFIAFDPFAIALSRLLHPDSLLGPLMLLALVAMAAYFFRGRRLFHLALSAVAAGFSWLTKSPSLFLIPFFGLLSLLEIRNIGLQNLRLGGKGWGRLIKPGLIWLAIAALVFVVFWPSMWVNPLGTLKNVFGQAINYAEEGHNINLFFAGKIYPGSIRDLTFYPVNFLWRTTLPVLIGLVLAGLAFIFRRKLDFPKEIRWTIFTLALFAVLFTAFLSVGGKKFDRYLIPIFAPLDLVAGLGWAVIVQNVFQNTLSLGYSNLRSKAIIGFARTAVILGVIIAQFANVLQARASYLSFYNPSLGGITKASNVMMIGWGEGLEQAANYLNDKPNAGKLVVLSWYPQIFSYNFVGRTIQKDFSANPEDLEKADYYVVYINQWQRDLPSPEFIHYMEGLTPEHVVQINGVDYVRIYHLGKKPPGG